MPVAYKHKVVSIDKILKSCTKLNGFNRTFLDNLLPNEITVLTGNNGCGKSTVCDAIINMYGMGNNLGYDRPSTDSDKILTVAYNARAKGTHSVRGSGNYEHSLDNLDERCISEGESMLVSLTNFTTETLILATAIKELYDYVNTHDRPWYYDYTFFLREDAKHVREIETNNSMYIPEYLRWRDMMGYVLERGLDVDQVASYLSLHKTDESIQFIVTIDEFDGGVSSVNSALVLRVISNLKRELTKLFTDTRIIFKVIVATTDFVTTKGLFTGNNLYWMPDLKYLKVDILTFEYFSALFSTDTSNVSAMMLEKYSTSLEKLKKHGFDIESFKSRLVLEGV